MTTIGVLGSGNIGFAVAKQFIAAGNKVVMSNHHGPESLKTVIDELGPNAVAGTPLQAEQQDIVLLAVLRPAVREVLTQTPDWSGKILIDATNELPTSTNELGLNGSEYVAHYAPGAHVVKAFNTLFARHLTGQTAAGKRVLFYAGDDADSKKTVGTLVEQMGYRGVYLGTIKAASPLMEFGNVLSGAHFVEPQDED